MRIYSSGSGIIFEDEDSRICVEPSGRVSAVTELIPEVGLSAEVFLFLGRLNVDGIAYLLVVTQAITVGHFRLPQSAPIYRIERVCAIPSTADEKVLLKCVEVSLNTGRLKQGKDKILRFVQDKINSTPPSQIQEVLRLFNENPDFYYCRERDLTIDTQCYFSKEAAGNEFKWNYNILSCIREANLSSEEQKKWMVPIIQGFVRTVDLSLVEDSQVPTVMQLTLISRRSVNRAGARYLRRGIDNDSNVANYVESELILNIFDHHLSFVQIRGSVPLFWSQKGYKYRPPLVIDHPIEESLPHFEKHISSLIAIYGAPLIAINLVDQTGRELQLAKGYIEHAIKHNSESLIFVSFDLHHHCRGLKFDRISTLIFAIETELNGLGFCWVDKTGEVVRQQTGIVRTNCVDCLDRTNVVQGAISQYVCMKQAQRLGIFGPLCEPPEALVNILQTLWADNGDAISTQYAGTAALKGDVTRCGERKLAGIVKDGYNSASRYYLSHVKDTARQKAMNLLLGVPDQGTETMAESAEEEDDEEDESVSRLVNETIHFLLPEHEVVVGGWGLVEAQNGGDSVDSILLLTRKCLHVATYDDESQKLIDVKMLPLMELERLELGQYSRSSPICLKIQPKSENPGIILHPAKTRLFNNVAIRLKSQDEADEYIESIAEQIRVTFQMTTSKELQLLTGSKLTVNRQTTARKAFASMTSALKMTLQKSFIPTPVIKKPGSPTGSEDSGTCTPLPEEPAIDPHKFSDDTALEKVGTLGEKMVAPADVRPSSSEGRLVDKQSPNLVSRLKGLPFIKGIANRADPFEVFSGAMNESHTRFIIL